MNILCKVTLMCQQNAKKLIIVFGFSTVVFLLGLYYYKRSIFDSEANKCDLMIFWTKNEPSNDNGDFRCRNDRGVPSGFHCLTKCPGKSNCFCEKHDGRCSPPEQYCSVFVLDGNSTKYFSKTPPIIACPEKTNKIGSGMLVGTNWATIFSKTITLKLLNGCGDIKQIVIKPSEPCNENRQKISFNVKYPKSDSKFLMWSSEFRQNIDKIDLITTVVFYDTPPCVVVVYFIRKMFWSDKKRGTIEMLDLDQTRRHTLVHKLNSPGSISVDPESAYLFWCNHAFSGSIERINLDGKNRVDITSSKYYFRYPDGLTIDQQKKILYWIADHVIHTSDFDGNGHKIVLDTKDFYAIGTDCIAFSAGREFGVYWDGRNVGNRHSSMHASFLLLVTHTKNDDTPYRIPDDMRRPKNVEHLYSCLRNPNGYHCVCPDDQVGDKPSLLDVSGYLSNSTLTEIGYVPMSVKHLPSFDTGILDITGGTPFDYNSNTRKLYYYDDILQQIRVVNMAYKTKIPVAIVKNINLPTNGLAYDWMTNNLYFIDSGKQNIKVIGLNHYNPETIINSIENSSVEALAVHPHQSLLFFIRRDSMSKTIFKYTLNGSAGMFKVAEMKKGSSNFLMVDHRKNLIYWTNIYTTSIEKVDFNGNHYKTCSTPKMYPFILKLRLDISETDIELCISEEFCNSKI